MKIRLIRKIILGSVIIISLSCFEKKDGNIVERSRIENRDNDLKQYKLQGRVKSFKETSYEAIEHFGEIKKGKRKRLFPLTENDFQNLYNEDGNLIAENSYDLDGNLTSKAIYKYDKNNKKAECNVYNPDGNLITKYIYRYSKTGKQTVERSINYDIYGRQQPSTISEYDINGNQIEYKSYALSGGLSFHTSYIYDENGNQVEMKSFHNNKLGFYETYKYNQNGNQIELARYNSDGSLSLKTNRKYDQHGNVIERASDSGDKDIYKYDNMGNQIEWIRYFNSVVIEKRIYTYDKYGNQTRIQYSQNNDIKHYKSYYDSEHTSEYIYDKNNNWISKIEFNNGKAKLIIEREFEYYE